MNKRVLLAWELGSGAGHFLRLAWTAGTLEKHGYEPILAVPQPETASHFRDQLQGLKLVRAPAWRGLPSPPGPGRRRPVSMGDILADQGLHSSESADALIDEADRLIAATAPLAVVADYAPATLLAARGRVPTVAVGNAFTLPPWRPDRFANLDHLNRAPLFDEEETLLLLNRTLTLKGRDGLRRLPEIFWADRHCVGTFAELDPYASERDAPPVSPWLPSWERGSPQKRAEIFCYLSTNSPLQSTVLKALMRIAPQMRVRLHIRHLVPEAVELLTGSDIAVELGPVPFAQIEVNASLVVSLGSFGLVSCALTAGVPQIVLPPNLAMDVTGRAVEALGVGRCLRLQPDNPLEAALLAQSWKRPPTPP